jgi:hypothetical protein
MNPINPKGKLFTSAARRNFEVQAVTRMQLVPSVASL